MLYMNESLLHSAFGLDEFTVQEASALLGVDSKSLLTRLKQAGILIRVRRGVYQFRTDGGAALVGQKLASLDLAAERRTEEDIRALAATAKIRWDDWIASGRLTVKEGHYEWRVADA